MSQHNVMKRPLPSSNKTNEPSHLIIIIMAADPDYKTASFSLMVIRHTHAYTLGVLGELAESLVNTGTFSVTDSQRTLHV